MKCNNCPLKDSNLQCIVEITGHTPYCDKTNQNHPEYDERMVDSVVKNSKDIVKNMKSDGLGGFAYKQPAAPPLIGKIMNYGEAMARHIFTGSHIVKDEVQKTRLNMCESCELYFDREKRVCNHEKCGCPVDKKVKWASESCPIDRWGTEKDLTSYSNSDCGCGQQKTPALS